MKRMKKLFAIALSAALLAGCAAQGTGPHNGNGLILINIQGDSPDSGQDTSANTELNPQILCGQ